MTHHTKLTISISTQPIYKIKKAKIVVDSFLEPSEKAATIFNKASWRCGRSNRRNITIVGGDRESRCGPDARCAYLLGGVHVLCLLDGVHVRCILGGMHVLGRKPGYETRFRAPRLNDKYIAKMN